MEKHVLGIKLATDPRWINIAEKNIQDILIDHAYCEQKAASSCISLIIQYPEMDKVVETLTPIVAEEWGHFERVMEELRKRNMPFGMPRKDEYVERLQKVVKKGGSRIDQLVEKLLMNAMIEARSCERFRLLWKEISDAELSKFYYELMLSEAGHYRTFLTLAKHYKKPDWVEKRWKDFLAEETEIVKRLEVRGDRMH